MGPLHKGGHVFREGDYFRAIYVVRSGYVKVYTGSNSGEERILGFDMGGDLFGIDSISAGRMLCSAEVLDTAMICRLPFEDLIRACREVPGLQRQLFRLMSRRLATSYALSGNYTVEAQLASFLLGWGERLARRGFSPRRFVLPMARYDIANHLRLTPETVSRCFARFVERGWIEAYRREIDLADPAALAALCPNDRRA